MEAAVIFCEENDHPLSGALRRGYKHVFCAVPSPHDDATSIIVDFTLLSGISILPVDGTVAGVAAHYDEEGLEAFLVPYRPERRSKWPVLLNNCVGLTKNIVGIRSWALTPWQLRCRILKDQMECLNSPSPAEASSAAAAQ